jgi:hypothetical protein
VKGFSSAICIPNELISDFTQQVVATALSISTREVATRPPSPLQWQQRQMTPITDIIGSFSLTTCTPIPPNSKQNHMTPRPLHAGFNTNAKAIATDLGGGNYRHLSLCIYDTDYLALITG